MKVAPFCDRPDEWNQLQYISVNSERKCLLDSISGDDEIITGDRKEKPRSDKPHRLSFVVRKYPKSIEHKSLAPDGSKCAEDTIGLLRRRPIRASGIVHHLGKEVSRGTSIDPEYLDETKLARYPDLIRRKRNQFQYREPEALKKLSIRKLASKSKLGAKTVERFRDGIPVSQKTIRKLLQYARKLERRKTSG